MLLLPSPQPPEGRCWMDPLNVSSICMVPLETTDSAADSKELSLPSMNWLTITVPRIMVPMIIMIFFKFMTPFLQYMNLRPESVSRKTATTQKFTRQANTEAVANTVIISDLFSACFIASVVLTSLITPIKMSI